MTVLSFLLIPEVNVNFLIKRIFYISEVPQGLVLGPLLFNVFINDIVDVIDYNFFLYAADCDLGYIIFDIYSTVCKKYFFFYK